MSELGIPFEEKLVPFGQGPMGNAFRSFSPSGRVPCLHDGDAVVWDSLAIVEYLAEDHPAVWPSHRVARAWARSASAEMHSGFAALRTQCGMICGIRMRLHEIGAPLKADIDRIGELWSEGLDRFGGPFLAGDTFTAVDAFFAPVAFRVQTYGLVLPGPAAAYARRLLALPSMRRWYDASLQESWREEKYEQETLRYGELTEDFRTA
ncbi:glutathione S-transferase [Dyella jiangningensis]|uniref:Glutathione S-transferase n=2 Tax=Dyella jiangningensis TaxID=1379159 RepID=A0A328NWG6_9GAMM|nr:glutathione S-transferase [Dyella jiangningensis]